MFAFIASATSATVTASQAVIPAEQIPFAITAAITVALLAAGTFILDARSKKAHAGRRSK